LGTAGHNGFVQAQAFGGSLPLFERGFLPGQHGAALVEDNWDDIAHFIVYGEPNQTPAVKLSSKRNGFVVAVGIVSPSLWLVLLTLLGLIDWGIWA
jgi:hypothetical protein